jgi:hypothetical protein
MERNVIRDKSRDFDSLFFVRALPNEYLVEIGRKKARPVLGGRRFRPFRRFLKIPASVQVIKFSVNNHSKNYQGIQVEGYACWRIDPEQVDRAVTTLDFYNAFDPLQKTSEDLKTICTEAIRHIVANMEIEETLKNKDGIAVQLRSHLRDIEGRWGILFDQVGIEKITVMSDKVFGDLQAKERDKLRLDASLSKFESDRKICDAGALFERDTKQAALKSQRDQKIMEYEHEKELKQKELELRKKNLEMENEMAARTLAAKTELEMQRRQREMELERRSMEIAHAAELQKIENQLAQAGRQKELELTLLEQEKTRLERERIAQEQSLRLMREQREIDNMLSREYVMSKLVEQLPGCMQALKIHSLDVNLGPGQVEKALAAVLAALKDAKM